MIAALRYRGAAMLTPNQSHDDDVDLFDERAVVARPAATS